MQLIKALYNKYLSLFKAGVLNCCLAGHRYVVFEGFYFCFYVWNHMPLGEAYICQLATVTTPLHIGLGQLTLYIYN